MSGLRTFCSELNPKISSIYYNYFDNWWAKIVALSSSVLVLIIFNLIPSWIQFGLILLSTIGMWSFFSNKKPTYQPTKRQFTVTTNYNNVNVNSNNLKSPNLSLNHLKQHGAGQGNQVSPFMSKSLDKGSRTLDDQELDQSSSSSTTAGDWNQNTSRREPIDPITLSAVTSPGFSTRLIQKRDGNALRESNSDLSFSPISRGSSYHNQKSPNSYKLGQLPSPSWKPQPKLNPPSFRSPVNVNRYTATRRSKKQDPFGTTYVHVAPVDVINKSLAASKVSSNPNSPNSARPGISFGMGGYPSSPTANITTRMQKLWSPPTMDSINPYETSGRTNVGSSNNISCPVDPGLNRKRNRLADNMVDKRSSTIHHGPSSYGQEDLAKQNSKRTKYIQSTNDLRYSNVNSANRNLPYLALPNLQTHDDESVTSSILEQMKQTEKRILPDDDTISPMRSPKKTRSSNPGAKGSSVGQNSSSPYRKRRVADQSLTNLLEEDEAEKNRGFCSCSECYEEAAGMNAKGKKIPKQSSPINDSVSSSKKKKTVTFNQCKSTSLNQSKGYISAMTVEKKQDSITDRYAPVQMQIISKANYEADKERRLERLNRMLNESFKRSEYKPKTPEVKITQLPSNGIGTITAPLSFGACKEPPVSQSGFSSSIFSSSSVRAGEDQVEGTKQVPSTLAPTIINSEASKTVPTADENSSANVNLSNTTPSLFAFGAQSAQSESANNPPTSLFSQISPPSVKFGQDTVSPSSATVSGFGNKSDLTTSSHTQQGSDTISFGASAAPVVTASDSSGSSFSAGFSFGAPVSVASSAAPGIFGGGKSETSPAVSSLITTGTPATTSATSSLFGGSIPSSLITTSSSTASPSSFGFSVASTPSLFSKSSPAPATDITTTTSSTAAPPSTSSVPPTFAFGQVGTSDAAPVTTASAPAFMFGGSTPSVSTTKVDTQIPHPAPSFSFGQSGSTTEASKISSVVPTTEVKTGGFSFGQVTSTPSTDLTSSNSVPIFGQTSGGFQFGADAAATTISGPVSVSQGTQESSVAGIPGATISFGQNSANSGTSIGTTQSLFGNNKDIANSGTGLFGQTTTSAPTNLFNTTSSTTTGSLPNTTVPSIANTNVATAPSFSFGQASGSQAQSGQNLNNSTSFGQSSSSGGFGFNPVFGQKSGESAPSTSAPTSFGQNAGSATVPSFGQGANSPPSTAFGQATSGSGSTGLFGQGNTSVTSPNISFGQGDNTTANISFGQSSSLATGGGFGQDKTSPNFSFGQTSTSTFGQPNTGVAVPSFGQANTSSATPTFGQSSTASSVPTFGQGNSGTATPTFGQSNTGTSTPTFGQGTTPIAGFGQGSQGSTPAIFGQGNAGGTTALFGQGNTNGNAVSFGQNSTATSPGFGKASNGVGGTMFGQANTSSSGNLFGQSPSGTPNFGQSTQGTTSPFGQSNTTATNTFGQPGGSSGVFSFGQTSSTPTFGQANTSGTNFGSPTNKPAFGQNASSSNSGGGSFPSFGQSTPAPSGGFNFGAAAGNNPSLTATPQSSPFGGASSGGFSTPQPQAGSGMFGNTTTSNQPSAGVFQFGQQQQQPSQGGFNFGQQQQQQQQQQPFGGAPQQQQPMFNMGTSTSSARRRDTRGRRYR